MSGSAPSRKRRCVRMSAKATIDWQCPCCRMITVEGGEVWFDTRTPRHICADCAKILNRQRSDDRVKKRTGDAK